MVVLGTTVPVHTKTMEVKSKPGKCEKVKTGRGYCFSRTTYGDVRFRLADQVSAHRHADQDDKLPELLRPSTLDCTVLTSSSSRNAFTYSIRQLYIEMSSSTCSERFGDSVDATISGFFAKVGKFVGHRPRMTIALTILVTVACGAGFATWTTENRGEELWVPQGTTAEKETERYEEDFPPQARLSQLIIQSSTVGGNVITKEGLLESMKLHTEIETKVASVAGEEYTLTDICVQSGSCQANSTICRCFISSVLGQWNYDLETLVADDDYMTTLNNFGDEDALNSVLGGTVFEGGVLVSAQAMVVSYFNENREEVKDGEEVDPINEGWEEQVFLNVAEQAIEDFPTISVDYFAARSFADEFGAEISGDLVFVQISYAIAFLFVGASMGRVKCGTGSRWTMALAALITVGLSTAAGFGLSSLFGLFYGPIHALLPFVLLGIGKFF